MREIIAIGIGVRDECVCSICMCGIVVMMCSLWVYNNDIIYCMHCGMLVVCRSDGLIIHVVNLEGESIVSSCGNDTMNRGN